jgi:hypothetical protein
MRVFASWATLAVAVLATLVGVINGVLAVLRKPKRKSHVRVAAAAGAVAVAAAAAWAIARRHRAQPAIAAFVDDTFPEVTTDATPLQTALL